MLAVPQVPDDVFRNAVASFWARRARGVRTGSTMNGFADTIRELLVKHGVHENDIYTRGRAAKLPGFFRSTKDWDLIVIVKRQLRVVVELKSQVGSLGNNFNNRVEEALGNAEDFWTAYRERAFGASPTPWLGYLLLLGDEPGAHSPVKEGKPLFPVHPDFQGTSYAKRYELYCRKLVLERKYSAACFIVADPTQAASPINYVEPASDLSAARFLRQLLLNAVPSL